MSLVARCRVRWLLALIVIVLAAGCATPPRATAPGDTGPWSGRLALQVEDKQSQSFAAGFELKGTAQTGELALYSPVGSTLAVLAWAPGSATLRANGQTRQFESLDALVAHVIGAAIPVPALFDWLRGIGTQVAGWQADLSQLGQGRLRAQRLEPPPQADLRVVLEQ